ncbi:gas vesicle protein GvpN [Geitlerinema sp. PCC 7407]|uniref:gas vesicle protein GvpN n=1 Tax=Geitlerinema sp. PCC 7407 TaxID=1173025 RepID=UPI00029FEBEF|nr:gas vesicle protein GvpN [Geitlerinema sp. PCC 7407]AFY65453.1 gas vesicle protein GvpN [Geitlerinema sp. PCC 7407]
MTTILQARSRNFVSTPAVERVTRRALRYLQSGFSVHLRGAAGTGKTTLAMHLADLLTRPIMLVFGDDEFKTSDLIGNQLGYTRKKVVDNFIHSVVKVEDELRQNWVDSRLTMACREGFTLVYDEFNRSRPEVNNVLLAALEEKLLVLPPSSNRTEYIRVSPHFRAIFTSNPEEYCGVHSTQDALLDRLVTINLPEPDELTQQEILVQKASVDRASALLIVRLVRAFRQRTTNTDKSSGLRSCLMVAKVCQDHNIVARPHDPDFRDVCSDVLLSRSSLPLKEATQFLWELLNDPAYQDLESGLESALGVSPAEPAPAIAPLPEESTSEAPPETLAETQPEAEPDTLEAPEALAEEAAPAHLEETLPPLAEAAIALAHDLEALAADLTPPVPEESLASPEQAIYAYLQESQGARLSELEGALGFSRIQTVNALKSLTEKGAVLVQRDGSVVPVS